jgi:hypothetical protein
MAPRARSTASMFRDSDIPVGVRGGQREHLYRPLHLELHVLDGEVAALIGQRPCNLGCALSQAGGDLVEYGGPIETAGSPDLVSRCCRQRNGALDLLGADRTQFSRDETKSLIFSHFSLPHG